jgi:hypothetical protein
MLKTEPAVIIFAAAISLLLQVAQVDGAYGQSGIVDKCNSTASSATGMNVACPQRDGDALGTAGLTVSVTVRDNTNFPMVGLAPTDIWLVGCDFKLMFCGGTTGINAAAPTNAQGQTTITGRIAAGGCEAGVRVVVQGTLIGGGACAPICLGIAIRSPDLVGAAGGPPDLRVNSLDLARFATDYRSPPKAYNACVDYAAPFGVVDLGDFAVFGRHFTHQCD